MGRALPNIEWVSVVVSWFATDLDAKKCCIVPKSEYIPADVETKPFAWSVGGKDRNNAPVVLKNSGGIINYGGTPSDASVRELCIELKNRGYKIMLYPMLFVDMTSPAKPWRGRIYAKQTEHIQDFFCKPSDGYNNFILHYAKLCSGLIDAIIIGSEMKGLTSFRDAMNKFPAVDEFINLAAKVKNILGNLPVVTYAADWSEYHHAPGGWFNMDSLWASENIDVIGIDAYFPLTPDLYEREITEAKIKAGWNSGEGWDYYYTDASRSRKEYFSDCKYAWKNIEYWWNNKHQNPDGSFSVWIPRSKPIWFTEFGFASTDGSTNQPNVFYDKYSSDSHLPRRSIGSTNFMSQRRALNASYEYFKEIQQREPNLIAKSFLWTWDGRPYPNWPDRRYVWADGAAWQRGHWINGKVGMATIGGILTHILKQTGLETEDFEIINLDQFVHGFVIKQHISARAAIEQLQRAYFFEVYEREGKLKFYSKLEGQQVEKIHISQLACDISGSNISSSFEIKRGQEIELPATINVNYIDPARKYDIATTSVTKNITKSREQITFNLPIVMSCLDAQKVAQIALYLAWSERNIYSFMLPTYFAHLDAGDIITIYDRDSMYQMRIAQIAMSNRAVSSGRAVGFDSGCTTQIDYKELNFDSIIDDPAPDPTGDTELEIIDIPSMSQMTMNNNCILYAGGRGSTKNWRGARIFISPDSGHDYIPVSEIEDEMTLGITENKLNPGSAFVFDNDNKLIVRMISGGLVSAPRLSVLGGGNIAIVGDEVLQFERAILIGDNIYQLSGLLRGRCGTDHEISKHRKNDRFILFNSALVGSNIPIHLIGVPLLYKAVTVGQNISEVTEKSFICNGKSLKPYAPVHLKSNNKYNGDVEITWIRQSRIRNGWYNFSDVPIGEENEKYIIEIIYNKRIIRIFESTETRILYTKKHQMDDNIEGTIIEVLIYQISAIVGKGYSSTLKINL